MADPKPNSTLVDNSIYVTVILLHTAAVCNISSEGLCIGRIGLLVGKTGFKVIASRLNVETLLKILNKWSNNKKSCYSSPVTLVFVLAKVSVSDLKGTHLHRQ